MKATWWGAGMLAAALLAAPTDARADDDRWGRPSWRGGLFSRHDAFGEGYERGFRDGAKHGQKDARKRRGFDFRHEDDYWEADNGYKRSYGSRREYAAGYRHGYREGYEEAHYSAGGHGRYDRYDPPYGSWRYDPRHRGVAHRHEGVGGWCYERHDRWDDRIYELPRR